MSLNMRQRCSKEAYRYEDVVCCWLYHRKSFLNAKGASCSRRSCQLTYLKCFHLPPCGIALLIRLSMFDRH